MPYVIFCLILIGVAMWAFNTYIPMQNPWKMLINVLVFLCVAWWLMGIFFGPFAFPAPHYHLHP